jgi:hypothetical protein
MLNVTVRDGSVDLWGFVTSDDEKKQPGSPWKAYPASRRSTII